MFQGKAPDPAQLRWEWSAMLARSGAAAAVAGVTAAGDWIGVLQFPAEADAGTPAEQPCGQTESFGSGDVDVVLAGWPAEGAGFVQVMRATVTDRAGWAAVDRAGVPIFAAARPDFLGSLRIWRDGDRLTVVDSFTSEAEARAGEAVPVPAEDQAVYDAWFGFLTDVAWYDLTDPWRT